MPRSKRNSSTRRTRATVPGVEDIVLESIEEHHIVKWVLPKSNIRTPTKNPSTPR